MGNLSQQCLKKIAKESPSMIAKVTIHKENRKLTLITGVK